MTEANLPTFVAFLTSCTTCIVFINRAKSVHNSRKKTVIHFATLGAIYIYIGHSTMKHVHNLMKSQLYTYLGSEGRLALPLSVAEFDGLCTEFEKNNYALW